MFSFTLDIYCTSVHPGRGIPHMWLSLRFLLSFYPVKSLFFCSFPLLLLRVKGRGCHTLLKPYETNCGLWIWAIQIKFDWLIEMVSLGLQVEIKARSFIEPPWHEVQLWTSGLGRWRRQFRFLRERESQDWGIEQCCSGQPGHQQWWWGVVFSYYCWGVRTEDVTPC